MKILLTAGLTFIAASLGAQSNISTASAPLVAPNAPRILFEAPAGAKTQLWIMDGDGNGVRQLTNESSGVSGEHWAANGNSLFYYVTEGDRSTLYELWPDSARQKLIGVFPGRAVHVAPGRAQVIYDVGPWSKSHLVMTDINQRSTRQLTSDDFVVWMGVWSPDGKRIAYTARDKSGLAVWVMNADGSHPHRVTHLTPQEGAAQMPAWSPDSQLLAFQANSLTSRGKATLWIIDLRTLGEREIIPHQSIFLDETPSFFPDGTRVAFQSNRSGKMEIWAVNTNGTDLRQLTGRTK